MFVQWWGAQFPVITWTGPIVSHWCQIAGTRDWQSPKRWARPSFRCRGILNGKSSPPALTTMQLEHRGRGKAAFLWQHCHIWCEGSIIRKGQDFMAQKMKNGKGLTGGHPNLNCASVNCFIRVLSNWDLTQKAEIPLPLLLQMATLVATRFSAHVQMKTNREIMKAE